VKRAGSPVVPAAMSVSARAVRRRGARAALVLAALLAGVTRAGAAEGDAPYEKLVPLAGDSHQHAATLYLSERQAKDPPTYFGKHLHENSTAAEAYDLMRKGGLDWGSLSFHDTNFPGVFANICIDPASEKYRWWISKMSAKGFPDATSDKGAAVDPPSNEALALSKVAESKNAEGDGGFLALAGREFTNVNFFPTAVGARQGGHKIVVIPGETSGLCTADGLLRGDEYCLDEFHLYRWIAAQPDPKPVLIQAHPGGPQAMDLRPLHPQNAPGGFTDQFVVGIEVSSKSQDPQWEPAYQRALHLGYRLFPAFGSDNHYATYKGNEPTAALGATICWASARTRRALVEAMHARRCYYATSWKPELRFSARAHGSETWLPMGAEIESAGGLVDVRIHARNDPRNRNPDPRLGKRFDTLELVDDHGVLVASCGVGAKPRPDAKECRCTRADDGADTCSLAIDSLALRPGAVYPRILMKDPAPEGCRSKGTPVFLPGCNKVVIGAPIFVDWPAFRARTPYRVCQLHADHLPCGEPGCLAKDVDRDQDGWPDDCDVCPDVANPDQADRDLNGIGDACEGK
jgi:hypothetical protein